MSRKDDIQAYLLGELMKEMVMYSSCDYVVNYVGYVNKQYKLLDDDKKMKIDEKYKQFMDEFKIVFI